MSWLAGLGTLLGGLGARQGALNGRQARRHGRRLEALEEQHSGAWAQHGEQHAALDRARLLKPPDAR